MNFFLLNETLYHIHIFVLLYEYIYSFFSDVVTLLGDILRLNFLMEADHGYTMPSKNLQKVIGKVLPNC